MSAIYTIIILALFALGMPVAFVLMLGGVLGMLFFLGGPAAFTQIPVIAYKTLDDFVLVAVPLYILMSEILLKGKVARQQVARPSAGRHRRRDNLRLRNLRRDIGLERGDGRDDRRHGHPGDAQARL